MLESFYNSISTIVMYEIIFSVALVTVFFIVKKVLRRLVKSRAGIHDFDHVRILYVQNAISVCLWIVLLVILSVIWHISFEGLAIYAASIFTVIGVGLFANWSMVSNITASVILYFFFPFRVGSKVKIVDGDNSAEGIVLGLSLFSIHLEREDGKEIYYPNNLALQKSIVCLDNKDVES